MELDEKNVINVHDAPDLVTANHQFVIRLQKFLKFIRRGDGGINVESCLIMKFITLSMFSQL